MIWGERQNNAPEQPTNFLRFPLKMPAPLGFLEFHAWEERICSLKLRKECAEKEGAKENCQKQSLFVLPLAETATSWRTADVKSAERREWTRRSKRLRENLRVGKKGSLATCSHVVNESSLYFHSFLSSFACRVFAKCLRNNNLPSNMNSHAVVSLPFLSLSPSLPA